MGLVFTNVTKNPDKPDWLVGIFRRLKRVLYQIITRSSSGMNILPSVIEKAS